MGGQYVCNSRKFIYFRDKIYAVCAGRSSRVLDNSCSCDRYHRGRSLVLVPGERRNILCESAHYEYSVTVCTGSKYRMVYCLFWKAGKVTLDIHTIGMYNKHTVSM